MPMIHNIKYFISYQIFTNYKTLNFTTVTMSKNKLLFLTGPQTTDYTLQAERLHRDYHYNHISVAKLIREEIQNNTDRSKKIQDSINEGSNVADDIVVNLLQKAIQGQNQKFVITGFPRTSTQAQLFESKVQQIELILHFKDDNDSVCQRIEEKANTLTFENDDAKENYIDQSISNFKGDFYSLCESYKQLNLIKTIDVTQDNFSVYNQIQNALKQNLIYVYGPPCVGKTEVCKILAQKIKYHYVNVSDLQNQSQANSNFTNQFIDHIQNSQFQNILIDGFPFDKNQIELIFDQLGTPFKIYYFDISKDEVFDRILKYSEQKDNHINEYDDFIAKRVSNLQRLQNNSFFVKINAQQSIVLLIQEIINNLKPLFIVQFYQHNQDLGCQYAQMIEEQRDFVYIDIDEIKDLEMARGSAIGAKLKTSKTFNEPVSNLVMIDLVSKIIFRNPNKTRYMIQGFPIESQQFETFENQLFEIDLLVSFINKNQQLNYYNQLSPVMSFYSKCKHIFIDQLNLDILDAYIQKRPKYAMVVGAPCVGKTTIAKYIEKNFNHFLIEWGENLENNVKAAQKDPDSVEQVTFEMYCGYFANLIQNSSKTVIFDGTGPFDHEQFQKFFDSFGSPHVIVNLNIDEEQLTKRYQVKNGLTVGEPIEDRTDLDKFIAKGKELQTYYKDIAVQNFGISVFDVDANLTLYSTQKSIDSIFQYRVFCTVDLIPTNVENIQEIQEEQRLYFLNICLNKNITFVDVEKIVKNSYWKINNPLNSEFKSQYQMLSSDKDPCCPSSYNPQLVLKAVKLYLDQFYIKSRDILLYGFPSGKESFARPSDQLYHVEQVLGPVRIISLFLDKKTQFRIEQETWELQKPEPPKPKTIINEEGVEVEAPPEEDENKEEDDGEEKKVKFNKFDFTWTRSTCAKSLIQWYCNKKCTRKFNYSLKNHSFEGAFSQFLSYYDLINEKNDLNNEDEQMRKVNLSIQFVYDDIEVEEDVEVEEEEEVQQDNDLLDAQGDDQQNEQTAEQQQEPEEQPQE